jgi:hypothetical protein
VYERIWKRTLKCCDSYALSVTAIRSPSKLKWASCLFLSLVFYITQIHSQERLGARKEYSPPPTWSEIRFDEDKTQLKATTFVLVYDSSKMVNEDSLKVMLRDITKFYMQNKFPRATLVITLFAKKECARPRREVRKGELKAWKANYLARYDAWEKELLIFPEDPKRRKKILFDLCPDAKETFADPNKTLGAFFHIHCQGKKHWEK